MLLLEVRAVHNKVAFNASKCFGEGAFAQTLNDLCASDDMALRFMRQRAQVVLTLREERRSFLPSCFVELSQSHSKHFVQDVWLTMRFLFCGNDVAS
jgi:hypothetical protein